MSISEIAIWPLTLIFVLKMFKETVEKKLKDVLHFKASAEGVEATFFEKGLNVMTEENTLPQVARSRSIGPEDNLKPVLTDSTLPPYEHLFMINSKVEEYLKSMAKNNDISIDDFESLSMIKKLLYEKVIDVSKAQKLENIINLVRAARPNINKDQVNIVSTYYNNL